MAKKDTFVIDDILNGELKDTVTTDKKSGKADGADVLNGDAKTTDDKDKSSDTAADDILNGELKVGSRYAKYGKMWEVESFTQGLPNVKQV